MSYQSNSNAVLINGCNPLQNLTVLLKVTEDLATTEGNGFSLQLNAYPPPGQYSQYQQLTIFQYIIYVLNNTLYYEIQYWANSSTWPPGYTPAPNTTPWLPVLPNDYFLTQFGSAPGNTIPRDSEMQIALTTDQNSNVTAAAFSVTDPDGNTSSSSFSFPNGAQYPITAFEFNLVGPGSGSNCTFTTGLTSSRGIIYYSVDPGTLAVQSGGPGAACGESGFFTAETSNAVYSDVVGAPASTVTQTLGQPVDCAINNLFQSDARTVGQMRKVRDEKLVATPAGQWLIEMLERHSADLVGVVARDPALANESRKLLRNAGKLARDGSTYDDDLVDQATQLVERASCLLPPSMFGKAAAMQTILESLRGNTLERGIAAASQTIRPRFGPTQPPEPCADRIRRLESEVARLREQLAQLTAAL